MNAHILLHQGGYYACNNEQVKVKLVSADKKSNLQYELDVLRSLVNRSKFFVKPFHDSLIPSNEFTVTDSFVQNDPRFNNHFAMVLEKGEITLADFLKHNYQELSQGILLFIVSCLVNIVKDAHNVGYVLMDIKDQNVMQFKVGPGLYSWRGIDLDGSLEVDTVLSKSKFMATIPFMAPELMTGAETHARFSLDIWSLGILIFNTVIYKQPRQTFWTLQGIHSDDAIKEEITQGRLTQAKIDTLIDRTFSGSNNSSRRHFFQRMLKINPTERWTIDALEKAALLDGSSSISPSIQVDGNSKILREVQLLSDKMAIINTLASPTDIKDLLAKLNGSNLAADQKKAAELKAIDGSPPALQYYVTMQVSMNGFLQACTVISSDMVSIQQRGVAGSITAAIGAFSSLANPGPCVVFGLELLQAAVVKIDEQQQMQGVDRVVTTFRGDAVVISMVAEGVARGMALYRKTELEALAKRQSPKTKGFFQMAVNHYSSKTDSDASKEQATVDAKTIMQDLMSGDLTITSGTLSTATNEQKAESITGEIVAFMQSKKP